MWPSKLVADVSRLQLGAGIGLQDFRSNRMAVAAVDPKLLIVSEAAFRLGGEAEKLGCCDRNAAAHLKAASRSGSRLSSLHFYFATKLAAFSARCF